MSNMSNQHIIGNQEDALKFIKYYNAFHDGFIKRIYLESKDYFEEEKKENILNKVKVITGEIDLRIDIAHYNYGAGEPPFNRVICVKFEEFEDLVIDISQPKQFEWDIIELKFNQISIPLKTDASYSKKVFEFWMENPVYDREKGWYHIQQSLFTFSKAIAWEEEL